jgi:phosphoglucosamine mutase
LAAPVFSALGAQVTTLADNPDGRNINGACGSEHPAALCRAVVASGARAGLAFDGDADRVVAVDESGAVLSGDEVIAILAQDLDRRQRLRPRCVVTTVMSNLGLGLALRRMGIALHTSDVGDRRVMEVMGRTGAVLGGEDSGHIILRDVHTTGDGMLAGLRLMSVLAGGGAPLSSLARVMTRYPQVLRSVPVKTKPPIESLEAVTAQIQAAQQTLQEQGRVLVRYSGTQALCRVMVEGPSREAIEVMCSRIADALRGAIG